MANVLVVSGSYYPHASANAACMKEFEKKLIEQGHSVTYVIRQHDIDTGTFTKQGDVEIYHVPRSVDNFYRTCETLKKQPLPQPMKALFRGGLAAIKAVMRVYSKLFYGSLRNFAEKKYLNAYADCIEKIVNEKKIDLIISVSMPFLSHQAVLQYLSRSGNAQIKWLAYMIDAYSQKYHAENKLKKTQQELQVLARADKILMLSVLKESYEGKEFQPFTSKIFTLPIPVFNLVSASKEQGSIQKRAGYIECVFAGTLYDDTSALDYFAKYLEGLGLSTRLRFHFMGKRYPRNEEILRNLQSQGFDITLYPMMPSEFAEKAIEQADIVLNIGNLSTNQIPSKIFQYMQKKKPILTFYRIEDDPAIPYLEKYPLACNIFEDEKALRSEELERVRQFIETAPSIDVKTEQLQELFSEDTSEAVCSRFMDGISDLL